MYNEKICYFLRSNFLQNSLHTLKLEPLAITVPYFKKSPPRTFIGFTRHTQGLLIMTCTNYDI